MVPPLHRYGGKLRLPVARPAPLRCLRLAVTIARSCVLLPHRVERFEVGAWALGLRPGALPLPATESTGPPRFLGNPSACAPCSPTPVGPPRQAMRRVGTAAAQKTTAAPASSFISRLNHTARTLPVYASQPGSPPNHATLGSGWSPAFAGRDCPAGFLCKVSVMSSHVVLLTQALPGALSAETPYVGRRPEERAHHAGLQCRRALRSRASACREPVWGYSSGARTAVGLVGPRCFGYPRPRISCALARSWLRWRERRRERS